MINKLKKYIGEYFVGKEDTIECLLICLLAGGHILLEGVPGVGKTTLASTLAKSVKCDFGRIQFTPDTLPTDVMGTEIFNMKTGEFEYREGAVMHQIVLADEINRTSPKTQASLLEAMAEGQTTVSGVKHKLPQPFMVIATQNPATFMGTYPLPEAQIDRFMMKVTLEYPDEAEELRMTRNMLEGKTTETAESVITAEEVLQMSGDDERGKALCARREPESDTLARKGVAGEGVYRRTRLRKTGRCKGSGSLCPHAQTDPDLRSKDRQRG